MTFEFEKVDLDLATSLLSEAGFVAADEEAREIAKYANGDATIFASVLARRLSGEPLAWIIGFVVFCGLRIAVSPGVFVPRWQSEMLVRRAVARLPERGVAIDVCTGSGAVAMTLLSERPQSRVLASDVDNRAVACASSNGVEVYQGDLFDPLPRDLEGCVDVVVGVVPYVPTKSLSFLPRDTLVFESAISYDGGDDGTAIIRRVLRDAPSFLRPGGALLLELGGDEAELILDDLARHGFLDVSVIKDVDGDVRGIEATRRE
jgi:release factor glutamine methyltransferase